MPAPSISVTLRKSSATLNPQDLSAITCWVGCCSRGTVNAMQTVTQSSSLRTTAGYGPVVSGVAETLGVGGAPVYLVPSAIDTPGVVAAVVKTPISGGVATYVGGYVKLAGADHNGDIGFQSLVGGVTLVISAGANSALVTGSTGAWNVALTLPAATAASVFQTFWNSGDVGATAARALLHATFFSTAASNAGTSLASTVLDNGAITLTAPATGYTYELTTGAAQAAAASYSTDALTIALGCDVNSEPTGLTSAMITLINAATPVPTSGRILAAPVGAATGILGTLPTTFTALQYGSTAAMSLTGNPTDYMPNLHIVCSTGGALGTAQIQWTIDGQTGTYSAPVLVPGSGSVVLSNPNFDTGLTAVFTGILAAGDYWDSSATPPTSSVASLLAALTVGLNDPTRKFGVVAIAQPCGLTDVVQLDNLIQSTWGAKFCEAILPTRDLNPGETDSNYVIAINATYLAFESVHGLTDLVPGGYVFSDGYTGYTYGLPAYNGSATAGRPCVIAAVARNSAIPVHESLGRVATGSIRNCIGISHDERLAPGLFDKYVTTQTYDQRPGLQYFSGCSTTADPSDPAYTREPWVSLACEVGRIAASAAFVFIGDTVNTATVPESNGAVPAGAFTVDQARTIENTVSAPIEEFLFSPKTDGRPSANRLPSVDSSGAPLKTVTCLRDYSALATKQIRLQVLFSRLGIIESIAIGINLL